MTNFNLIDIFTQVFNDLFSYVDISHKFMCEVPQSTLNSTEEVNILVGVSGDIDGNIMFGYTEKTAKDICAKLMGVSEVKNLDKYAQAALADFYSEFCNRVAGYIKTENLFNVAKYEKDYALLTTSPTYIAGLEMHGMISKVPSKKLFFKVNEEKFAITYNLEEK